MSDLEGSYGHPAADQTVQERASAHGPIPPVEDGIDCSGGGVCLETETQLSLRVLPRPFSHIYALPQADADGIVSANIPAFRPLYVFERKDLDLRDAPAPKGWYRVGPSSKESIGWMQAQDVMEWRQALLVSYTHPGGLLEGRNPVLMFHDAQPLRDLLDSFDMGDQAKTLYQRIDADDIPEEIISMEPKRFVDITEQFYILPILQWEQTQIMGDDVRLLQLAAAVPSQRGADTLADDAYRDQAAKDRGSGEGARLEDIQVDIVFVIDTTRSMQPFIDMTKVAVSNMVRSFSEDTSERFRFGLVGFRDDIKTIPYLEYTAKNFTPQLVEGPTMVRLMEEEFRATEVGSLDYAEEVFAGVDLALRSDWRKDALKIIILIGDASSHPKGHLQNVTGKDESDLRLEADDARVHLTAIHLKFPPAAEDHPISEPQFLKLSQVRGLNDSSYIAINASKEDEYQAMVDDTVREINALLNKAVGVDTATEPEMSPTLTPEQAAAAQQGREAITKVWEAALVEYIGKAATPPKDITAWVLDRDLVHTADRALDVRILITRDQLSSLALALDQVVQALMRAEITQARFFESLQSVAGQTMKRPEDLAQAEQLADSGLLPSFISSLPYQSDILALSDEMFAGMTADQRSQLEWNILAKLEQYRAINEQVDAWFRLNDTDPDQDLVYPLHLDYLP
ncbi:vWA domain-containing protein [Desulfonatronum lacustre]|uniref:vWA domain-containing protein n=1 Tax=Desulfonatronum lacustre TaxID=66849 RepID=UPI001FE0D0B5|nr:vWA domain-containing protein [Desulfonatronum lacustre]